MAAKDSYLRELQEHLEAMPLPVVQPAPASLESAPRSSSKETDMTENQVLLHSNTDEIEGLLLGRTVTVVGDNTLTLDDGTQLTLVGNEGCGGCNNGRYDLTALNGVDNVITRAAFFEAPNDTNGLYQIFVYAAHDMINLVTFEGGDGNGFYGTGYHIRVTHPQ
jgi:hypothetical protein